MLLLPPTVGACGAVAVAKVAVVTLDPPVTVAVGVVELVAYVAGVVLLAPLTVGA